MPFYQLNWSQNSKNQYNWRLDFLSISYFFDTYSIEKFCNQAIGKKHLSNECQIWTLFSHWTLWCGCPEAWLQNFSMKYVSKKYEFDKKSNLQVHWLLETEISFIDRMAFSYYIKILLWVRLSCLVRSRMYLNKTKTILVS